jgi:hypothetical protein
MNRQLYQLGGPIEQARSFYTNNLGMNPQEADAVLGDAMASLNQQNQPQSMMEMASGGIARLGYQMGGVSTMPMDYGQSLQVPQQMPTNFSSAQNITMNPLLNYGQPQLGQAGGTPLSMNRGGIARLGYQMGGEAMMQPQGMQQEQPMQLGEGDNALLTIIQLLIEQGVDPETAEKLARQILQIFAQGGEPALDQFIGQLEQEEQTQEMAEGGIAGYVQRKNYGFGSIFKSVGKAVSSVAKAVKSVAKSKIGKIALTVAAGYFLGPAGGMFGGAGLGASLTTNAFLAGAINAGAANLLVQGVTTGKFNPKEALLAGVLGGATGYMSPGTVGIDPVTGQAMTSSASNITSDFSKVGLGNPDSMLGLNVPAGDAVIGADVARAGTYASTGIEGTTGNLTDYRALTQDMSGTAKPGIFQNLQTKMSNALSNPIQTLKNVGTGAIDLIEQNPKTAVAVGTGIGLGTGIALGAPQQENESDEDFAKRQQEEVNPLITYYGRNLQIKNPYFYQKFGATDPFAPVATAAQGGIMGYKGGGSMVPPARQIEGGIIELDARKTGGYIPYGKKERVDDVPAMLAKDEFVFTSRAVKAAGGGSAQRGAAKMYALMKKLEGARA